MKQEKLEKCLVAAINNLLDVNEGVVVSYEDQKFIVKHYKSGVEISKITENDEEIVRNMPIGEIIYMEE